MVVRRLLKSKSERVLAELELNPLPNTKEIENIAEKVGCTKRTAFLALKQFRAKQKTKEEEFTLVEGLIYDIFEMRDIFFSFVRAKRFTTNDRNRFNRIINKADKLKEKLNLDNFEEVPEEKELIKTNFDIF